MKKEIIEELRRLTREELNRRIKISNLLKVKEVLEYLELTNTPKVEVNYTNIEEIIKDILNNYDFNKISRTNEIYVCTSAFTRYKAVPIDSDAEVKTYKDIESGRTIEEKNVNTYEFERDNIVLNPFNSNDNLNGYNLVRNDFFIETIRKGQPQGKKLILKKYPSMISIIN